MPGVFGGEVRMSSAAANRSVVNHRVPEGGSAGGPPSEQKSEIFVDIIERLTVRPPVPAPRAPLTPPPR